MNLIKNHIFCIKSILRILWVYIERKYSYASSYSFSAGILDVLGYSIIISKLKNLVKYLTGLANWENWKPNTISTNGL